MYFRERKIRGRLLHYTESIDNMNDLKNFEIVTMNDFCEISNSDILIRKPDHSLLRWAIVVSHSFGNRSVSRRVMKSPRLG